MVTIIDYHDYMLSRNRWTYPSAPYLRVAGDTDLLAMIATNPLNSVAFSYQVLLLTGCLIDDLCGDPVR